ncbi:30S ribosomal protein S17 [Candidatus Gottesmanbacteria bacterium]|nr:30S ribosomal protein S17 [Candidatus Gottesmanbacteria bacterium]
MAKFLDGKVVKVIGENTVKVDVIRMYEHPLYKKRIKRSKRYIVHYEGEAPKVGTKVKIIATRPISKNKHYKMVTK